MPSHLRRYNEPGHIHFWTVSCHRRLGFFHDDGMKRIVCDGLTKMRDRFGVCLVAYVVMLDHIHAIVYPHPRGAKQPVPVSTLLRTFKQHVGYHGKRYLREYWRRHRRLWSDPLTGWATDADAEKPIWTTRGYDFNIDRYDTPREKLDYCRKNPVTRSLVDRAEDWFWSSYRFYELDDRSALAMDWDGAWPILW